MMLVPVQVWRTAHHLSSVIPGGLVHKPALVHTGFYRAWVANGLHKQVLQHLQVGRQAWASHCCR